jgi:hypothetical protein
VHQQVTLGLTLIQAEYLSFMMDTGLKQVQHQLDQLVLKVEQDLQELLEQQVLQDLRAHLVQEALEHLGG